MAYSPEEIDAAIAGLANQAPPEQSQSTNRSAARLYSPDEIDAAMSAAQPPAPMRGEIGQIVNEGGLPDVPQMGPATQPSLGARIARGARRALNPLIGPSAEQKFEEAVPTEDVHGNRVFRYKPAADDVEQSGAAQLIPIVGAMFPSDRAKAFPRVSAADIAAGNFKTLLPGVDPETGESIYAEHGMHEEAPVWAKIAAGVQHGVAGTAEAIGQMTAVSPPGVSVGSKLANRAMSLIFGTKTLKELPNVVGSLNDAIQRGDWQTAAEALTGGGIAAYFGAKAYQHALGPGEVPQFDNDGQPIIDPQTGKQKITYTGIAEESPLVRDLLSRKITETYTPDQLKDIYRRVNTGQATPAEQELARFINQEIESPGKALRQGVQISKYEPKVQSQFWRDYLGLKPGQTTASLMPERSAAAPEAGPVTPNAPAAEQVPPNAAGRLPRLLTNREIDEAIDQQSTQGGPNAPTKQGPVAQVPSGTAEAPKAVPPVAGGGAGPVQPTAGASAQKAQPEAPRPVAPPVVPPPDGSTAVQTSTGQVISDPKASTPAEVIEKHKIDPSEVTSTGVVAGEVYHPTDGVVTPASIDAAQKQGITMAPPKPPEPAQPTPALTHQEILNRPPGMTSPQEIASLSDDEFAKLIAAKKEGGAKAFVPTFDATRWAIHHPNASPAELQQLRDQAIKNHLDSGAKVLDRSQWFADALHALTKTPVGLENIKLVEQMLQKQTTLPEKQVQPQPSPTVAKGPLGELFRQYDEVDGIASVQELVERVGELVSEGKAPASLGKAVDRYKKAVEDNFNLAGRGDMDEEDERFLAALQKAIEKEGSKSAKSKKVVATPAPPAAPAPKSVGFNAKGQEIFEDENGVRSIVEDGVKITEPVQIIPTREGIRTGIGERGPDYIPVVKGPDETSGTQTLVAGSGSPAGAIPGEAGSAPEQRPTETALGPSGGANVEAPAPAPASPAAPEPTGGGGVESGEVRGPAEPGLPSGGSAAGNEPAGSAETAAVPASSRASNPERPVSTDPNAVNHVIAPDDVIAPKGAITKLRANIAALMLLRQLEDQNRNATPTEKKILAQYTGWGSLSQVFNEKNGSAMMGGAYWNRDEKWEKQWGKYYEQLKGLLSEEEWRAAARSSQYAHFTSRTVVPRMWQMAEQIGFMGGTVLEFGAGVGNFFGLAPEAIRPNSRFVGVEQDNLSSRIMAKLYPQAKVINSKLEDVKLPANGADLVIGNVPFSDRVIKDDRYPVGLNLHNYFLARALDAVKPGGMVIEITTSHTMDSQSAMRQYLAGRAELMAAFRLPNDAFKENAGTEVSTDILVLRKPMTPTPTAGEPWANLSTVKTHDGKDVAINEYWANHPENVLGLVSLEGTMHAREEYATIPKPDSNLDELLRDAVARVPKDMFERLPAQNVDFAGLGEAKGLKDNTLLVKDGTLTMAQGGSFVDPSKIIPQLKDPVRVGQAIKYLGVKDAYLKLIASQTDPDRDAAEVENDRKALRKLYDEYVKRYGFLNGRTSEFLDFEHGYYLLMGLEREAISMNERTGKATATYHRADVLDKRTQFPRTEPETAANLGDAIAISNSYRGRIDSTYVGKMLGMKVEDAEQAMLTAGLAFRNPGSGLLETPVRYLSGNVRKKLAEAESAAADDPQYQKNVDELKKVQPATVPFRSIRVKLGTTYVPDSLVTQFAKDIFQSYTGGIKYSDAGDTWIVGGFRQTPQITQTFATGRFDGEELLTKALNMKSPMVYDTVDEPGGGTRRVFNSVETEKARTMIDRIQGEFTRWLSKNKDAQAVIEKAHNEALNSYVDADWNIARLDLPGSSSEIAFRANQREAVWRIIQDPHGVLAHSVGSGKTYVMIAAAMEMRRLGIAKKPMIAVKNATLGQFANAFRKLYPSANILIATKDDLSAENRKRFLSRIASGDYDSVIIPHSQLGMLEDDPEFEKQLVNDMLDELVEAIHEAKKAADGDTRGKDPTVKFLEKQKEKLEERLKKLAERKKEDTINFSQLGVDALFVDEAHAFKKPPFVTKLDRVGGLEKTTSQRAYSLFLKARYIQSKNNGRNVILATGTPVTNTLGEAWHMLNLASPHILKEFGVDTFDKFVSTFAEIKNSLDVNAVGKLTLKTRLALFVNGPELLRMIASSWDVLNKDQLRRVLEAEKTTYPDLEGGKVEQIIVPRTSQVAEFNDYLLDVFDRYKGLEGKEKKLYSYVPVLTFLAGKYAALDIRLVRPDAPDEPGSKINVACRRIFETWKATAKDRLTQAVFFDSFNQFDMSNIDNFMSGAGPTVDETDADEADDAPKQRKRTDELFLYRDMKAKLVAMGIPENEILIVNEHDVNKPESALLFDKVNSGEYRVAIGSTAKFGTGVNIQKRLYALHHLDTPWYPADLEQRNGRIERPLNQNKTIQIIYYGMKDTIDAGLYAKNEAKAKFAQQVLSGNIPSREFEDPMGQMVATMAEQVAALSGDPMVLEKVMLESKLRTLRLAKEAFLDDMATKERAQQQIVSCIQSNKNRNAEQTALLQVVTPLLKDKSLTGVIGGRSYTERKDLLAAMQTLIDDHIRKVLKGIAEKRYAKPLKNGYIEIDASGDGMLKLGRINNDVGIGAAFEARMLTSRDEAGNVMINPSVSVEFMRAAVLVGGAEERLELGYPKTPDGLLRALPEVPNDIQSGIDDRNRDTEAKMKELEEIAKLLQATFPQEAELAAAEQRMQEIQEAVISGMSTVGRKAADTLFNLGIDKAPLLIRIQNALNDVSTRLSAAMIDRDRFHGRMMLNKEGSRQRLDAEKEYKKADETAAELQGRISDLTKRLKVVEEARMLYAQEGGADEMPYGKTPARRPGKSYSPEATETAEGLQLTAQGMDEIRTMLTNPDNGLTPTARLVAQAFLDQPVMRNLDWSKLVVELKNAIEGGAAGAATVSDYLIELSKLASASTFPHEVFHFLWHMLPESIQDRIEEFRVQRANEMLSSSNPAMLDLRALLGDKVLDRIAKGRMTSDQFMKILNSMIEDGLAQAEDFRKLYPLINPSEFLAEFASKKFADDTFNKRHDPDAETIWNRIRTWLKGLIDAIKKWLGVRPSMEKITEDMLAGKNVTTPEGGADFERALHPAGAPGASRGGPKEEPTGKPAPAPAAPSPDDAGVTMADIELQGEAERALRDAEAEGFTTEVFGRKDTILGRETIGPEERAKGAEHAGNVLRQSGLEVTQDESGLWSLVDPNWESEPEGRKLLEHLTNELATQGQPGKQTGYLGNLLNSIVVNMTPDSVTAFSPELKRQLYALAQGERSHRGVMLAALSGFGKSVDYIARNVDVVLNRVYSDAFGGSSVGKVMQSVIASFRGYFTDDEIKAALGTTPKLEEFVSQVIALNRRDDAGRLYRKFQNLMKPKAAPKLNRLESNAMINEALEHMINEAKKQGMEPIPQPGKPLSPIRRLVLMMNPKTAPKINRMIEQAVEDGERQAGIAAALKNAPDQQTRDDLLDRFSAGEEPTDEDIESGLLLKQFQHWKVIRDNLLDYSPVTLKLARDVIKGDFRGTRFKQRQMRPADTRIDLMELAKSPQDEIRRALDAYYDNLRQTIDLDKASDEAKQRIMGMVEQEVSTQLEQAKARVREPLFTAPVPHGKPPTPEQRIAQMINAGLLGDPRLDIPSMLATVANKSTLQRLVPSAAVLAKRVLSTPAYQQNQFASQFASQMTDKLGIDEKDAQAAGKLFTTAFEPKFAQARQMALKAAEAALTPRERQQMPVNKPTWKKIEQAVNAGIFDTGVVLQRIAAGKGWWIPGQNVLDKMRAAAERIQALRTLSPIELEQVGDNPKDIEAATKEKEAATLEQRIALKKEIETYWARMTHPLSILPGWKQNRQNIAAAINEFTSANLLFKIGFPFRLGIDILTQGAIHGPTRAIGAAVGRWMADKGAGREANLYKDVTQALADAYKTRFSVWKANLLLAKRAMAGAGEARNVERLLSRIALFERMMQRAEEYQAKGDHGRAFALHLLSLVRYSYHVAQTLDNFQGLPAEYQEMRQQIVTALRENGMTRAEAQVHADNVMGDMKAEWQLAIGRVLEIFDANGIQASQDAVKAAALHVVKSRQYARMQTLGLPADDFVEINRILRSTIAWAEREDAGIGGAIGQAMRYGTKTLEKMGLPFPLGRFSNAIATSINRALMFSPFGFFPAAFGATKYDAEGNALDGSVWMRTPEDRRQRKVEAGFGSSMGMLFALLILSGMVIYRSRPPRDKAEREKWEKEGHRPNTFEIVLPDGKFIPISAQVGPLRPFAPYGAAFQAAKDLIDSRTRAQAKMDAEALKRGMTAGKVPGVTVAELLGVAAETAYATLLGGRTSTGLIGSVTDQGQPNVSKAVSGTLSPLVPVLPAYQEVSRMMGVQMDPHMASVFDYMVPLPNSTAARSNVLGDNVGTPDALQRVIQTLTAGTYGVVDPQQAADSTAYAALFNSGFKIPSVSANKAFAINGEYRPLTPDEMNQYSDARARYLKEELTAAGPNATEAEARDAYRRADARAKQDIGADAPANAPGRSGGSSTPVQRVPAAGRGASAQGSPKLPTGQLPNATLQPANIAHQQQPIVGGGGARHGSGTAPGIRAAVHGARRAPAPLRSRTRGARAFRKGPRIGTGRIRVSTGLRIGRGLRRR